MSIFQASFANANECDWCVLSCYFSHLTQTHFLFFVVIALINHLDDHLFVASQHSFTQGQVWHCLLLLLSITEEHKQLSNYLLVVAFSFFYFLFSFFFLPLLSCWWLVLCVTCCFQWWHLEFHMYIIFFCTHNSFICLFVVFLAATPIILSVNATFV